MADYESKVKISVDDSQLDDAKKKIDNLNGKNIKANVQVSGGQNLNNVSKNFNNANKSASAFGNTVKGFAKFGAYLNIFQMIEKGARQAVEAIKEIDSVIVDLQNATGSSYSNIKSLISDYNSLAKELGATTTEIGKGADNWLRQGKSIAETNTLLKDSMVLSKVAKLDSEESTKYLTAISKGYKKTVDEVSSINDSLTSIDMAAAVDAGGLAEAASRVSATAELAGVELNRLLGYEAAIGEASQEDMSVIGNSLKTIFTRMSDIKSGKLELIDEDGTVEALSDVETILTNIGVPLRNSANEFRDFDDVLDDTAKKWENLSSVQRAAVSKAFAGTRQSNRFQLLMENYDKALNYEKIANSSVGTAQKKFEENYLNSLEAKQKSLQASFESLSFNLVSRDTIGDIYDATSALVEFADKSGLAKTSLAGLATGVTLKGFTALTSSIVQASSKMNNFKQALDLIRGGNLGTNEVDKLGTLITGLSQSQQKAVLSSKALTDQQRIQALMVTGMSQAEAQAAVSTMGLSTAQGTATATTTTLSGALKGLFATIASNPLLMFSTVVMGTVAAYQALQAADKKFGLSYSSSLNLVKDSATSYDEAKQAVDSLNSELETTQSRISELQGLKDAGTISIAEEAELAKLREQNELLESQIQIKQKLMDSKAKETAEQAQKTLAKGEQSVAQQVAQNVPGGKKTYQGMVDNVNVIDAVNENVSAIQRYEKKIKSLQKSQAGYDPKSKEWQQASKDIEKYNDAIDKLNSDLNSKSSDLDTLLSAFSLNGEGITALAGYEEEFNAVKEALNSINNIDLSPAEKKLKSIEDFFSGSKNNFIKDNLLEAVKAGGKASDALELLGVNLKDAGIDADTLNRYFQEMANSASEAAEETSKINNNLTMSDIKSAFESENAGDDYVSLNDYMQKAKELFDQGLTGTDDFKSVAEMLSYNIDSTTESFKQNYDKLQRYFTEDGDGNLTGQGVQNFLTDLQSLGKGYATWNEEAGKWDINMSNTAQAAKELGVSVGVFEAILGRIKDYDNIGEFDFKSALKDFAEAKSSLEGLQAIYDEMEEGDRKTALGEKLKEWSPLIEQAENDLASLPDEVVTKLKFEFDLESLRQQMEEFDKQWENGNRSQEVGANRIASRESYRETRESQTGYNENTDASYAESYAKIESLRAQFDTAKTDEARQAIQDSISAVMDLQNSFQDAFAEGNAVDWNSFLQSDEAKNIIDGLDTDIKNMLDIPTHKQLEIGVGFTKDRVEQELAELTAGSTIEFTAELDGVERQVTAIKNEDGTITYTADVNGESVEVLLNQDGSVYYASAGQEPPKEGLAGVFYNWLGQDKANDGTAGVNYQKTGQEAPSDKTAGVWYKIKGVIGSIFGGGSSLGGTAHVEGTAHASGTLEDDSWIKPQWRTKKDEVSLVGEETPEMVATREGKWYTVGDKGAEFTHIPKDSVVFNGQQTKELLTKGRIRGRGRSLLGGTSYLGSSSGGFSFSGGASKYNGKSSQNSSSTKSSSVEQTTKASEEALDAISDYFDWIKVRFDRLSRETEIAEDAIEKAIGLQAKQSATANALAKVREEMDATIQGYNAYLAHADRVASELGLSSDLKYKVQNGTIDLTQYDDDTKKAIESYQSAYEDALDALDKVRKLQDKERELAQQRLENIEDFYKLVNDVSDKIKDANDASLEFDAAKGFSAVSDSVRKAYEESLKEAQTIYDNNLKQLEEYQSEFQSLMNQGYIQKGSDAYYEAVAKIYEFNEAISEAGTAIVEFEDKIREIEYTKIQYIIDGFERAVDKIDAQISLMQARDEKVPESIYQKQIDSNNQRIQANKDMRDAKLAEQAFYDVNSERYQELADEINKLDIETLGLMEDNEKLKDSIYELRFESLDEGIEKSRALRDEINDVRSLMDEDSFFDKDGKITESGLANIALLEQGIAAAKKEIADYRVGLEKLQESFDNGVISEAEYNEKSEEYRKGIRESVKDVQDYTESLTDLYITQMSKENESLKKSIQLRVRAIEAKESYYDYNKKITSQSKDVDALRSEISALEGVNNSQAKVRLKQLKQQLADAEDALNETKRSHSVEMQKDGYSEMMSNLDENLENLEYEISHNADKQQEVIQSMLNSVVNMYETAYGKINQIISNTGLAVSEGFEQNQSQLSTQFGAESQVSEATKSQSNVQANNSASNTVTNPINSNDSTNKQIESEITADPNTDNRLCAELTVNISSVTLEEGKSVSVSTSIRPSDAKNKTLSWDSSNTSIATVSGGTIKAVKPGTCQVIVSTTDGSGLSQTIAVTVTKKPEPPKPVTPPSQQTNGGDGVPNVGDLVTFANGSYYYDSEGVNPSGNMYQGQKVYITKINNASWATKPYHISTGNTLGNGDLGWVDLNQLRGYYTGTKRVNESGLAFMDDTQDGKLNPGSEVVITNHGILKQFEAGDHVFSSEQVQRLWELTKDFGFSKYVNINTDNIASKLPNIVNRNDMSQKMVINQYFDRLVNIEPRAVVTKEAIPGLQKEIDKMIPHISDKLGIFIRGDMRK